MIIAIGVDIVEVERIRLAMEDPRFTQRILTTRELGLAVNPQFVAGRWAVKEAVAKAVDVKLSWHDVEVLPDDQGRPVARIAHEKFDSAEYRLHVSISHEKGHAVGMAVVETA